ncbi:MAG: MATE family efflux transporter [bacterium]|nr:MATE family efflux transporter [bacterium]
MMIFTNPRRYFALGPLNRRIWRISLPVTLAMVTHTAVMITDTVMVGRLGEDALAAVSLGGTVFWTYISLFIGGSVGVQIITARRFGEHNLPAAGRVFISTLYIVLLIGSIATLIGWFSADALIHILSHGRPFSTTAESFLQIRFLGVMPYFLVFVLRAFCDGIGRTEIGLFTALATMFTNIFLNWVLIYGNLGATAYGADGAAMASSLASIPGLLVGLLFLLSREFRGFFRGVGWSMDAGSVKEVGYVGFAPAIDNFLMNVSFVFFFMLAGLVSTTAVAASGIIVSILSIAFMPGFGFSIAATTILGQAVAAGKYKEARQGTTRAAVYAALLMGGIGVLFLIFARPLLGFFTDDAKIIQEALPALFLVSLVQAADGAQMVFAAALRSAGMVYWVLFVYLGMSFVVMLPVAYLAGVYLGGGSAGLWAGILAWLTLLAVIFALKFRTSDWEGIEV